MLIINKDSSVTRMINAKEDRQKIFQTRLHIAQLKGYKKDYLLINK